MSLPCTFGYLHIRKQRSKRRVLRRTSIDTETYLSISGAHVAYTHLAEMYAVRRTLDAIIVLPPREAVPHRFYVRRDSRCCPVRIAAVGDHRTEVLVLPVLVLHGRFEPVLAVKVHHNTALVKPMMALREIGLGDERKEPLVRLHLQNRRIVIPEVVVRPLPEVGMRFGGDGNHAVFFLYFCGLTRPLHLSVNLVKSHCQFVSHTQFAFFCADLVIYVHFIGL